MLDILDLFLRPIGFVLALGLAFTITMSWIGVTMSPALNPWFRDRPVLMVLSFLISVPVGAIMLFLGWRAIRFAAGYTGSSDYPFQFVVRFIQHVFD